MEGASEWWCVRGEERSGLREAEGGWRGQQWEDAGREQ